MLVRLMRDRGLDFYWHDAHASNDYAYGFEWMPLAATKAASLATAIEVLEHVVDPLQFAREVFESTGAEWLLFTTEVHDASTDPSWHYFAPFSGQHVSFFSRKTLRSCRTTRRAVVGPRQAVDPRQVRAAPWLPGQDLLLLLAGEAPAVAGRSPLDGPAGLRDHHGASVLLNPLLRGIGFLPAFARFVISPARGMLLE